MDFSVVDKWLEKNLPDMEADLAGLVRHNSVEAKAEGDAPFGAEVEAALKAALDAAERLGFSVRNEHYYGIADMGDVEGSDGNFYAVLGHLDVVPAQPQEWEHDPFELFEDDGKLFGRGSIDDKGPVLAALYGAAALKKFGFEPQKPLRFIFGTNEETKMAGVAEYVKKEKMPLGGFTPDAEWPVVIGEKGIFHFELASKWNQDDAKDEPLTLISFESGTAKNIVPAKAQARFAINEGAELSFPDAEDVMVGLDGEDILITAYGIAAHGSTPEQGDNALTKLLHYIKDIKFGPAGAKDFVCKLDRLTIDDKNGSEMGFALSDDLSETTVSPNMLQINETEGSLLCDMRFAVTHNSEKYRQLLEELAQKEHLTAKHAAAAEPLFVSADTPLVKSLLKAYRDVTGDMRDPLIIGGGTYAKVIPNMVAFGCEPTDEPGRAHQANEYITADELLRAAKVYARAVYNLSK